MKIRSNPRSRGRIHLTDDLKQEKTYRMLKEEANTRRWKANLHNKSKDCPTQHNMITFIMLCDNKVKVHNITKHSNDWNCNFLYVIGMPRECNIKFYENLRANT